MVAGVANSGRHFLHRISRRYTKGQRIMRRTPSGYWRKTGKDHPIHANGVESGMKKILVFYACEDKKTKTKWVMHEYHHSAEQVTLCPPFTPED